MNFFIDCVVLLVFVGNFLVSLSLFRDNTTDSKLQKKLASIVLLSFAMIIYLIGALTGMFFIKLFCVPFLAFQFATDYWLYRYTRKSRG